MHSLKDYVKLISLSMRVPLNDADQYEVAKWLTADKEYDAMLQKIEAKILEVHESKTKSLSSYKSYKKSFVYRIK